MSDTWLNDDGLYVRFGTDQAESAVTGCPSTFGTERELVVDIDYSELPAFGDASTFINTIPVTALPSGVILKSGTITVTTGFTSGGAATLTLGLAEKDGTAIDADGIDAAIALTAIDTPGEEVVCDGALIGTKLAATGYVTVDVGVADYTAGRAKLVLKYIIPDA